MSLTLKVKMMTGKEYEVKAQSNITVLDLKKRIAEVTKVPAFTQKLATLSGELLLNWNLLSQHRLKTGDVLLLVVEEYQSMDILVRMDNRTKPYRIQLSQTVVQLKKMVQADEGISVNQFWFNFEGKPMEDNHHLGDYGLSPLCTIQMNLRLRGGV